jgi:hypothetical protein
MTAEGERAATLALSAVFARRLTGVTIADVVRLMAVTVLVALVSLPLKLVYGTEWIRQR